MTWRAALKSSEQSLSFRVPALQNSALGLRARAAYTPDVSSLITSFYSCPWWIKAPVIYGSVMQISSDNSGPCLDDCLSFIHLTGSFDGNTATGAFGCETALSQTPRGKNRSLHTSFRFAQNQTVTDEFKRRNEGWQEWICLLLHPKQSLFSSAKGWQIRKGQRIDKPIILEAMIRLIEALCVWQYGRKEVLDTSVKLTFIASCSPLGKKPLEMVSSA